MRQKPCGLREALGAEPEPEGHLQSRPAASVNASPSTGARVPKTPEPKAREIREKGGREACSRLAAHTCSHAAGGGGLGVSSVRLLRGRPLLLSSLFAPLSLPFSLQGFQAAGSLGAT